MPLLHHRRDEEAGVFLYHTLLLPSHWLRAAAGGIKHSLLPLGVSQHVHSARKKVSGRAADSRHKEVNAWDWASFTGVSHVQFD